MASYEAKNEVCKQCLAVVVLYASKAVGKTSHLGIQITELNLWTGTVLANIALFMKSVYFYFWLGYSISLI